MNEKHQQLIATSKIQIQQQQEKFRSERQVLQNSLKAEQENAKHLAEFFAN